LSLIPAWGANPPDSIAHNAYYVRDDQPELFFQCRRDIPRCGRVRDTIDSRAVSRFLVAAIEGCIGLYKVEHSPEQWAACRSEIRAYLEALRPERD